MRPNYYQHSQCVLAVWLVLAAAIMGNSRVSRVWLSIGIVTCLAIAKPAQSQSTVPGTIDGHFDVTLSGSASYTIPIKVPPGTAGTTPKIALVYDSQAPGGALGAGWSISGLSKITRGLKNLRTDRMVQGPNFDGNDAFYLDGQRLIPVATGSFACGSAAGFIKELDDQSCITVTNVGPQGPTGFMVHTKAGLTIQYGTTSDSLIRFNDGTILLWACNRIQDSSGNYITFHYALDNVSNSTPDYNVDKITYTGNTAAKSESICINKFRL